MVLENSHNNIVPTEPGLLGATSFLQKLKAGWQTFIGPRGFAGALFAPAESEEDDPTMLQFALLSVFLVGPFLLYISAAAFFVSPKNHFKTQAWAFWNTVIGLCFTVYVVVMEPELFVGEAPAIARMRQYRLSGGAEPWLGDPASGPELVTRFECVSAADCTASNAPSELCALARDEAQLCIANESFHAERQRLLLGVRGMAGAAPADRVASTTLPLTADASRERDVFFLWCEARATGAPAQLRFLVFPELRHAERWLIATETTEDLEGWCRVGSVFARGAYELDFVKCADASTVSGAAALSAKSR